MDDMDNRDLSTLLNAKRRALVFYLRSGGVCVVGGVVVGGDLESFKDSTGVNHKINLWIRLFILALVVSPGS